MPKDLSFKGKISTGTFYTPLHNLVEKGVQKQGIPPGKKDFTEWLERAYPGNRENLEVLDAGCGVHALNSRICSEHGIKKISAIDYNPEAIKNIQSQFPTLYTFFRWQ